MPESGHVSQVSSAMRSVDAVRWTYCRVDYVDAKQSRTKGTQADLQLECYEWGCNALEGSLERDCPWHLRLRSGLMAH